jgi:NAD(P)-dependent dehydrogenase (short-subunit alcohol dehydrogenase family)
MQDFQGKIAVVTGGASGIGLAMAERFAKEGCKLVIADIEAGALERAVASLRAGGADAIGVQTDVSKRPSVENLLVRTLEAHGRVNIVCNNAGVFVVGNSWQITAGEWEWIVGVNLWGVIHGVSVFVPQMLAQGDECHIVNTASVAGLMSVPMTSAYHVTKHGVVTLSESLSQELAQQKAKLGVSVLCPAFVSTNLHEADRNRPTEFKDASPMPAQMQAAIKQGVTALVTGGKPPSVIAEAVLRAIRADQLYVLTHPEVAATVRARMERLLAAFEKQA